MGTSYFLPRFVLLAAALPTFCFAESLDWALDEGLEDDFPVVLTAVRLKQLQSDVPASVTILNGQTLLDMGVKDLTEAFRLVPGMMVGFDANNQVPVVHYHGGPASLPRNLQVLLDGRSVYNSAVASVDWQNIPIAIEDIDRIEIVRGPNAASYGSNAYQAIISILSKHPADRRGTTFNQRNGNNGVSETYVNYSGGLSDTQYRFSLVHKEDDGYTHDDAGRSNAFASTFFDSQIRHRLFDGSELSVSAIYLESDKPLVSIPGSSDLIFSDKQHEVVKHEAAIQWDKSFSPQHKLKVSSFISHSENTSLSHATGPSLYNVVLDPIVADLYGRRPEVLLALTNPSVDLDYSALTPEELEQVALINQRYDFNNLHTFSGIVDNSLTETRLDTEVQDTWQFNAHFTLVSGVGFRRDIAESETFFSGFAANNTGRVFSSVDWDNLDKWKVHVGVMWEKESELDAVFNPRGAVVYRLAHNQSLRAVMSKSVRSPDMFETQTSWHYTLSDIQSEGIVYGDTYYQRLDIDDELRHEKILSKELGYYGLSANGKVEWDMRLFHEELTDVLEQNLRLDAWENSNSAEMYFRGVEYQTNYRPTEQTQWRMTYAYIDADSTSSGSTLLRVYAKNSGSLAWLQTWPSGLSSSVSYYLADSYNQMDKPDDIARYERVDARLSKEFSLDYQYDLATSFSMQKDLNDDGLVFKDVKYKDSVRYLVNLGVKF